MFMHPPQSQQPQSAIQQSSCPYPNIPAPTDVPLVTLPAHECPYLPDRRATSRAFYTHQLTADVYHDFMDAGFRRSGKVVYQPVCQGCRRCLPIRVVVDEFRPDKSQRRCARRNADLLIAQEQPQPTEEKFDLYRRYVSGWHQTPAKNSDTASAPGDEREAFEAFLYESPVDSLEFTYRSAAGQLLAVGICDVSKRSLSSVYFYFDPAQAGRGLGTFGALHELSVARAGGIPFYYLGYWVGGCAAMEYKSNFRPCQFLSSDGRWCDGSIASDIFRD